MLPAGQPLITHHSGPSSTTPIHSSPNTCHSDEEGAVPDEQTTLLIEMLANPRSKPHVRAHAVRLLGESGDPAAIRPLIGAIEDTADPFKLPVVTAVLSALPRFGRAAVEAYREVLAGDDAVRRPYMPR